MIAICGLLSPRATHATVPRCAAAACIGQSIKVFILEQAGHFTLFLIQSIGNDRRLQQSTASPQLRGDADPHCKSRCGIGAAPRRSLSHAHHLPSGSIPELRLLGQREDGRTLRCAW